MRHRSPPRRSPRRRSSPPSPSATDAHAQPGLDAEPRAQARPHPQPVDTSQRRRAHRRHKSNGERRHGTLRRSCPRGRRRATVRACIRGRLWLNRLSRPSRPSRPSRLRRLSRLSRAICLSRLRCITRPSRLSRPSPHQAPPPAQPPSPLPESTRRFLRPLVGIDPIVAHVHTAAAGQLPVGVDAATVGRDVLIAPGRGGDSPEALGLLAHELTHVAQGNVSSSGAATSAHAQARDATEREGQAPSPTDHGDAGGGGVSAPGPAHGAAGPAHGAPVQPTARPVQPTARPVQPMARPVQRMARPIQGRATDPGHEPGPAHGAPGQRTARRAAERHGATEPARGAAEPARGAAEPARVAAAGQADATHAPSFNRGGGGRACGSVRRGAARASASRRR